MGTHGGTEHGGDGERSLVETTWGERAVGLGFVGVGVGLTWAWSATMFLA